jgi:hypothetical protein
MDQGRILSMLTIIRSPVPCIAREDAALAGGAREFLDRAEQDPLHCQWIVPTSRRRRALERAWAGGGKQSTRLLPSLHTLESFVAKGLEYSLRQRPRVTGLERLLRVASAWQAIGGRAPGPGLVRQLDRFNRDWQACGLEIPKRGTEDRFARLLCDYVIGLRKDQRLDRVNAFLTLAEELENPRSWPCRLFLGQVRQIVFDGFHRLDVVELQLLAALARSCPTLVWLAGTKGQVSWQTVEFATDWLRGHVSDVLIEDHEPAATGMAVIGRQLFPAAPGHRPPATTELPGVYKLEALSPAEEVEEVARHIKADYHSALTTARPLRLSDVAVVLPGPGYDALVRESFPRQGLEFNLAGRSLLVSHSRPARVLLAALRLIQGGWRHDLLIDFVQQPIVRSKIEEFESFFDLIAERPRARRQLDFTTWMEHWRRYLARLESQIEDWKSGRLDLPERAALPREEYVEKQNQRLGELRKLVASLEAALSPAHQLDLLLHPPSATPASVRDLVNACLSLIHGYGIERWLSPTRSDLESVAPALPWVEYEKDQQAYEKLKLVLQTLAEVPDQHLVQTTDHRLDLLAALELALDGETYQIRTEDDAGVQCFEIREIRGLRFRHVYMLGLVDGQVPALPEEGMLVNRRRDQPALRAQLEQKEAEATYLFSQLFEAAQEKLVLSRPTQGDPGAPGLPSRFLTAVERLGQMTELMKVELTGSLRDAAIRLGRAERTAPGPLTCEKLWQPAKGSDRLKIEPLMAGLRQWRPRPGWPSDVHIEAPALLARLFPDERAFTPSELETYAACPFRYFGARVLRLEEREPADQARMHYGSLLHRVLEAFYVRIRGELGVPDNEPLPAIRAEQRSGLLDLFETAWSELDAGLLPPDLHTLFLHDRGVGRLFMEAMEEVEPTVGNLLNEFVLRDRERKPVRLGEDESGRAVHMTGKVDRVDRHREVAAHAVIFDYKTGKMATPKERVAKTGDGRMLQLPLYAALLQSVREDLHCIGGGYIHLHERTEAGARAIAFAGEGIDVRHRTPVPFEPEAARAKALEFAGMIRAGRFPLTVHGPSSSYVECTRYCAFRHACRHPEGYKP